MSTKTYGVAVPVLMPVRDVAADDEMSAASVAREQVVALLRERGITGYVIPPVYPDYGWRIAQSPDTAPEEADADVAQVRATVAKAMADADRAVKAFVDDARQRIEQEKAKRRKRWWHHLLRHRYA